MIVIRVDANEKIGTGHIMRCLSIAEQAKKKSEFLFIVADESGKEITDNMGFSSLVLHTKYDDMEAELSVLSQLICQLQVDMILVDSYHITKHYISKLSEMAPVSLIEDFIMEAYEANNIINYNIYARETEYQMMYKDVLTLRPINFLLGPSFAPLRKQFLNLNYYVREEVRSVLLTTGGTDPNNFAGIILENLIKNEKYKEYVFHVVSGTYNTNRDTLIEMEKKNQQVIIHENVLNMAELMLESDVVISAAGTTMYELAAVGVPTIAYAFVDNQDQIADEFSNEKITLFAGGSTMGMDERITIIIEQFDKLVRDYLLRNKLHQAMINKVDGMGAKRIYEIISGEQK